MDDAKSLHSLERKVLGVLPSHNSLKEVASHAGLKESQVMRTFQWLSQKGYVNLKEKAEEVTELDSNGRAYSEKGLPEERILRLLASDKKTFRQLVHEKGLTEEEVNVSIGILKRDELISVEKGRIGITEKGAKRLRDGSYVQLLQKLAFPKKISELSEGEKAALKAFGRRKGIVKTGFVKDVSAHLTSKGQSLVSKEKSELEKDVVDRLTTEMLKSGSWKTARLRSYNLEAPVPRVFFGKKQPYRRFLEEVRTKFVALGFEEMTGPIVESEFWNMDALFMPQFHSARDIHDVYYVKEPRHASDLPRQLVRKVRESHEKGIEGSRGWNYEFDEEKTSRLILRSQTTACSARKLASKDLKIPGKYFAMGRCFRYDVIDAKHLADFNQVEGIVVERGLNLRHLIGLLKLFAKEFCGSEEARVVPSYFPFTEPSAALYARHPHLGWIELGGAGIFRPEMVKPLVGKHVPVLAWGIGVDRLAMFRLGLNDIRELFSHDLEYLRKAKVV